MRVVLHYPALATLLMHGALFGSCTAFMGFADGYGAHDYTERPGMI